MKEGARRNIPISLCTRVTMDSTSFIAIVKARKGVFCLRPFFALDSNQKLSDHQKQSTKGPKFTRTHSLDGTFTVILPLFSQLSFHGLNFVSLPEPSLHPDISNSFRRLFPCLNGQLSTSKSMQCLKNPFRLNYFTPLAPVKTLPGPFRLTLSG
jgi:hypothetical protein